MKRILAISLTLVMLLVALTSCNASKDPSGNEGEKNHSGKRLSITLTIAETLPSCFAFENKDGNPYCFYAYDPEGHLYRVLWNDFTGLNEKDVVVVDHNDDIKKVDEVNPPGGWSPKYEVTAIEVSDVSSSCISKNEDDAVRQAYFSQRAHVTADSFLSWIELTGFLHLIPKEKRSF